MSIIDGALEMLNEVDVTGSAGNYAGATGNTVDIGHVLDQHPGEELEIVIECLETLDSAAGTCTANVQILRDNSDPATTAYKATGALAESIWVKGARYVYPLDGAGGRYLTGKIVTATTTATAGIFSARVQRRGQTQSNVNGFPGTGIHG